MLIGLSGYARSGKDTVAGILIERHAFTRVAFADTLKAVAEAVDPWVTPNARLSDLLHWHDEDLLNPGPPEWEFAKTRPEVRRILQALGVACREHIGENIWVNAAIGPVGCHDFTDDRNRCVISDVRFPNEAEAIVARGGEIWRIVRPGTGPVNGHQSETALDDWQHDRYLPNDGTLEALTAVVAGNLDACENWGRCVAGGTFGVTGRTS